MTESTEKPQATDTPQDASLFQVAGAVFWSFFGIRKGRHMRQDAVTIKPRQIIIVGVVLAVVFVLTLIALASFITRNAS